MARPSKQTETGGNLDARVRLEQLRFYAENHLHDLYLIPIIAGTVGVVLSLWVPLGWVIAWIFADSLLVVAYSMLCSRFLKQQGDEPRWVMRIGFIHGAHMLLWSSVIWWAWQSENPDNHLFILLVYVGLISASTARSNSHDVLFYADLFTPILAVIGLAAMDDGIIYHALSLGVFFYGTLMFLIGRRNHRNILEMISLKIENEALILSLTEQASTDPMTGARNRKTFIEIGEAEIQRSCRFNHPMSLLLLDIDRFKDINDTYGHLPADSVILEVVGVSREAMRVEDIMGRMGGDEFGFILPETSLGQAQIFAERIREAISNIAVRIDGKTVKVTASIGIALLRENDCMPNLLHRADMAMYRAKLEGRNRVFTES